MSKVKKTRCKDPREVPWHVAKKAIKRSCVIIHCECGNQYYAYNESGWATGSTCPHCKEENTVF